MTWGTVLQLVVLLLAIFVFVVFPIVDAWRATTAMRIAGGERDADGFQPPRSPALGGGRSA